MNHPMMRVFLKPASETDAQYRARLAQMSYIEFVSTLDSVQMGAENFFANFERLFQFSP
jgi:hypothetical protein